MLRPDTLPFPSYKLFTGYSGNDNEFVKKSNMVVSTWNVVSKQVLQPLECPKNFSEKQCTILEILNVENRDFLTFLAIYDCLLDIQYLKNATFFFAEIFSKF